MPQVGKRPQQFNPIERPRDNTDDLLAASNRAAARNRYRSEDHQEFVDPASPKVVPPMPSTRGEGG